MLVFPGLKAYYDLVTLGGLHGFLARDIDVAPDPVVVRDHKREFPAEPERAGEGFDAAFQDFDDLSLHGLVVLAGAAVR